LDLLKGVSNCNPLSADQEYQDSEGQRRT
jgi:hypothetical protein